MNILIDHYKNPRHKGEVKDPDITHEVINRKCGDKLSFTAQISDDKLIEIQHQGEGCFYCMVSASVACYTLQKRSIEEAQKEISGMRSWLRDEGESKPEPAELRALGEIRQFPVRIDCVDLAWKGLEEMLQKRS